MLVRKNGSSLENKRNSRRDFFQASANGSGNDRM